LPTLLLDASRIHHALLAAATVPLLGCFIGLLYPAPPKMRTSTHFAEAAKPTRCLMVFLPGFKDDETTFAKEGFLKALDDRHLPVDSIAADLSIGYYPRREVVSRLREDVIEPLESRHYKQIWLVGVSMGGLGAILLARDMFPRVAGLVLFSPYLGDIDDHPLLAEIDSAGGLLQWPAEEMQHEEQERGVWRFLKLIAEHPHAPPTVYLAAGDKDPLNLSNRLLGNALPPDRVFVTDGGHNWGPWVTLWSKFLDDSDFAARCGP
jgi:pimeloyl-ACP methyl ester carboxylesterase